ncbi:hypothetical protein Tco_1079799 [Tanacetum coccineum]|uniref:Uncharacterized protein n=1 Tax=Tanacetum coccineum TaxID=301880 RepID=A0ABQ5HT23_9ASTR
MELSCYRVPASFDQKHTRSSMKVPASLSGPLYKSFEHCTLETDGESVLREACPTRCLVVCLKRFLILLMAEFPLSWGKATDAPIGLQDSEVDWKHVNACRKIFIRNETRLHNMKCYATKSLLVYNIILAKEVRKIVEEDNNLGYMVNDK